MREPGGGGGGASEGASGDAGASVPVFSVRVYKQRFNFSAAHFMVFEDGSREPLHGHNYQVRVRLDGAVSASGMVVNFTPLKPLVQKLCDELNHRTLVPLRCEALAVEQAEGEVRVRHEGARFVFPAPDVALLPVSNTSTERLAEHLGERLAALLAERFPEARLRAIEVEVEESPGQCGACRLLPRVLSSGRP